MLPQLPIEVLSFEEWSEGFLTLLFETLNNVSHVGIPFRCKSQAICSAAAAQSLTLGLLVCGLSAAGLLAHERLARSSDRALKKT